MLLICVFSGSVDAPFFQELTGELPPEIQRALAPGEAEPKIKRRVGTAFAITFETMTKHRKVKLFFWSPSILRHTVSLG